MTYQFKKIGDFDWQDDPLGAAPATSMVEGYEYRIKPEPAAPKWPKAKMTVQQYANIFLQGRRWPDIADDVLAHACETGQVVPAEVFSAKVSEIDMRWIDLTCQAAQRERELGDMLHEVVKAVHELDPYRKVRVPTPKPTVYMNSFNHGEIVGRDMVIANNVRALCLSRQPYLVTNQELQDVVDKVK